MMDGLAASSSSESETLDRWSARKIRPIVVLYVVAVFAVFIAAAYFIFHSPGGVKALAVVAMGAVIAMVPGIAERLEYRATSMGIEKRTLKKTPAQFKEVFHWSQLSHAVAMRHGFKYSKIMPDTNPLRRFWNAHLSDQYSGEVHVEKEDLKRVLKIVERQGVALTGSNRRIDDSPG